MSLEWAVSHKHEYDITTTHKINEPSELSFKILGKDNVDAYKIGDVIEYEGKIYLVDKIDMDRDDYSIYTITCQQNAINLSKKINGKFEYIAETVQTLTSEVLEGSGWRLGKTDIPSNMKRHLITEEATALSNLNTIAENFGAVIIFNYDTVDILMQKGEQIDINDSTNLTTISVNKDGSDVITRLHVFGGVDKETGIETTILDKTNGLTYVEDYSFFLEQGFSLAYIQSRPEIFLREAVYRNTDLYDVEALYNAGLTQLQTQLYPQVTCNVKIVDIGKPIQLNMVANIYDSETQIHLTARITEVTVNKDNPKEIDIVLSNTVSYGSWMSDVVTKVDRIDSIVNDSNKSWQEILDEAKNNATDLINGGLKNSSVIVKPNCIIVGDSPNEEDMKNCWLWTSGGLGFSKEGVGGKVDVAMTMDGAIVADRITTGELNGAIIKAGTINADAISVQAYEQFQQGINIGATNYIKNSGNFTNSKYWIGDVTYKQNLLYCSGIVKNTTDIYLTGGEEYIHSATLITSTDMEITEDNLILGYVAYQPLGVPQTINSRGLTEEELSKEIPIIVVNSDTFECSQGNNVIISFESSKNLKSLKLSINNGDDFNYEGSILDSNVIFNLSHLVYGNYICQLLGEDEYGNKGYSKTFIVHIITDIKNSTIFSNIEIAKPYEIKANTETRIFIRYKTRQDLANGFIINPTINIDENYKIKNTQWEKGNIASDWKPNVSDVVDGTLNETKTLFAVESGKILGRVEEIEKSYATNDKIDEAITEVKNDVNEQIKDVNEQIGKLEDDFKDISLDGIIDEVEMMLIAENITQLNKEKIDVDERFNNLYNSVLLTGEAKIKLNEAKNFFDLKHAHLLNKINEIIDDNLFDEDEVLEFNRAIEQYQSALALLSKAFDDAIANIAENIANNYTDEKFAELKIELDKISLNVGNTATEFNDYKKITDEKISKIEMTANNINMSVSNVQENVNLMQLSQEELKREQTSLKDSLTSKVDDVSNSLNSFQNTVNSTFKDGIIDEAEALALESQIKLLNVEKTEIDNMYSSLYNNSDLVGTSKSNLYSAKTSYDAKHTNLMNSINSAISDNKITSNEQITVDTAFANYSNALATYSTRHAEAIESIAEKKKQDAMSYTNTKMAEINITPDAIISTVRNSQLYKDDLSGKVSQTDLSSAINQSANQIKHEVSQIYPTNESVSNSFSDLDRNLQNTYATKSLVTQTADSITQTVSKKVGKDEIISSINQTAESVKISASKFEIDGTTLLNGQMKMLPSNGATNYASLYAQRYGNGVNMIVELGGAQQDGSFEIISGNGAKYFWVNYKGAHSSNFHYFYTDGNTTLAYPTNCVWDNGCFRPSINQRGYLGTADYYWNQAWILNHYCNTLTVNKNASIGGNISLLGTTLTGTNVSAEFKYLGTSGNIASNGVITGNAIKSNNNIQANGEITSNSYMLGSGFYKGSTSYPCIATTVGATYMIDKMQIRNNNGLYLEMACVGGTVLGLNGVYISDAKFKSNIVEIDNPLNGKTALNLNKKESIGLDLIRHIKHYSFDMFDEHYEVGYIAQELPEKWIRKIQQQDEKGNYIDEYNMQVNTDKIIPELTLALQEQQKIIEDLQIRIEKLEKGGSHE